MAETLAQKHAREARERIAAHECIADIEAILNSVDLSVWDAAHQSRLRIAEYQKAVV